MKSSLIGFVSYVVLAAAALKTNCLKTFILFILPEATDNQSFSKLVHSGITNRQIILLGLILCVVLLAMG